MRYLVAALAYLLVVGTARAEVETAAAVNGASYAIIPQLFDGSAGSTSYIRLFNGNSATTTFTVLVINTKNGITVGSAAIQVPAYASPQYPLTGGSGSIFGLAGVASSTNASYALYIQDTDVGAGYAHVTYNGVSTLFENQSVCATPINQRLTSVGKQVLTNVHTTALAGNNYPSIISIHNYASAATSVNLAVYDAANGNSIGTLVQTISANGTLTLAESDLETQLGFHPTSSQLHLNIVVTHTSAATAPVTLSETIRNVQLGGEINMSEMCAVNSLSAAVTNPQPASTTPVAYCGTFRFPLTFPSPLPFVLYSFTIAVSSTTGRVTGNVYGTYAGSDYGDYFYGSVSGSSVVMTLSSDGSRGTGTVQNGIMNVVFSTLYGNVTVTGSQSACN